MAYFKDEQEREKYRQKFCRDCVYDPSRCPVWWVYGYLDMYYLKPGGVANAIREALDALIPTDRIGTPKKCSMFSPKKNK